MNIGGRKMTIVARVVVFVALGWFAVALVVYSVGAFRATHFTGDKWAIDRYLADTTNYAKAIAWLPRLIDKVYEVVGDVSTWFMARFISKRKR